VTDLMGNKLRKQRRRLGLSLDDLARQTGISKPYLSLIETGRVPNPPSDEKLTRLERALDFGAGELLAYAHLERTPQDVRALLHGLIRGIQARSAGPDSAGVSADVPVGASTVSVGKEAAGNRTGVVKALKVATAHAGVAPIVSEGKPSLAGEGASSSAEMMVAALERPAGSSGRRRSAVDSAYLSGVLQQLVDQTSSNIETLPTRAIPVINKVSAGYPKDFTDLSYPKGVADAYVSCPDVADPEAFAARVFGDSMTPKYRAGDIVIFSPRAPVNSGDDCFVRFESGNTTFKRVFFETDDTGNSVIRIQPRNEKYRPQTIPADQISGVYRAVYKYQSVVEEGGGMGSG
jgi:repressor LexA